MKEFQQFHFVTLAVFTRIDVLLFPLAVAPPQIVSLSPTGEVLPNTRQWVITFDKQVKLFRFSLSLLLHMYAWCTAAILQWEKKKCDMWKDILGWLKLLKVSNSQGYHKRQLISCLALEKTPKTGPSPNIGDHLTDGHFDSFLSLLLRTIAITDQNVGFELLAVVESSLQTLNSSFKMIRADFSNLTFFYSSCALQEAVTSGFIVRMARLCSVSMLQSQPLCCIRLGAWGGRLNSRLQWDSSRKRRTM